MTKSSNSPLAQSSYALWNKLKEQGQANKGSFYGFGVEVFQEIEGFNPRDYNDPETVEHIRMLADAYKRGDTLPPLMIRVIDDVVWVWDGHCRLRGAKLAISEGCPVNFLPTVEMSGDEIEQHMTVLKTKQGLELKPLAIALQIHRLFKLMGSEEAVANGLGKSKGYVIQHLELYNLPLGLKNLIQSGVVTKSTALEAFRDYGAQKSVEILTAIIEKQQSEQPVVGAATTEGAGAASDGEPVKKAPPRIKRGALAAMSGVRVSFSKKLIEKVTDGFNMLGSKIASLEAGKDAQLTLNADELAQLRQLIEDIKPKDSAENAADADAQPEQAPEEAPRVAA